MLIRIFQPWSLKESEVTSESVFLSRRSFMIEALSFSAAISLSQTASAQEPSFVPRNARYSISDLPSDEWYVTHYNNFYEFGAHKNIFRAAQEMPVRPWQIVIDGLVEKPLRLDIDDLLARVSLEERIYRLRCVEAWAFVVPWIGFPFKDLLNLVGPLSAAKYVQIETFYNPQIAPGQRQFWYPWPYIEGLTMSEARHDLSLLVTGAYGKPLLQQNGAPLRLAVPWKYGFKSIKSIVRITLTETPPVNFWQKVLGNEYGFWANVNPDVPHPRWSQKYERMLDTGTTRKTEIFNGYAEHVAHLYQGLEHEPLFM